MALKRRPAPHRPRLGNQQPGTDITVGEYIVDQIRVGVDPMNAAGVAGVMPQEFTAWMREGSVQVDRLNSGADWQTDFTIDQQDAALFAEAVVKAHATHIARLSAITEQGTRERVKTSSRSKVVNGQVVERIDTTETILPDLDMAKWKLERLEPQVYGSKATLNLNVTDLTDTETVGDTLEQRLLDIAEKLKARAIEATATELGPVEGPPQP